MKQLLLSLATTLLSCSLQAQQSNPPAIQAGPVQQLMDRYGEDEGNLRRFYVVDNSPERRSRLAAFNQDYFAQLHQLSFNGLSQDGKVDYILFQRTLNNELQQLQTEQEEFEQVKKYVPFADTIYSVEKLRRRGAHLNAQQIAASWADAANKVDDAMVTVPAMPGISDALRRRVDGTINGLQYALRSVYEFYAPYDPDFNWWAASPYTRLDSLLSQYAALLRNKKPEVEKRYDDGSGIVGHPIGKAALLQQLQYEMIPYAPEELVDIANKEFAWCEKEMLKASKEIGFGDDWKKALEKVKQTYVAPGEQPAMLMDLYNQSVDFVKKRDLLTVPPLAEETWRMQMMSPEWQKVAPFFLGGETLLIAYPTNTMDEADKMMSLRGNNPHFARAVLHHELIPGHGLQEFMTNRYKAYRHFDTPFWTEGWSLYWEMILWDMGFPRSPEDKVGMLFWRMHRCARIIFSLNYHLGNWTPKECIGFLVDRVGHERANAEGEVRRSFTGGYGPLYQIAYMIGALQFYALKNEVVDSGRMSLKDFHDRILQENRMPVEMVRALLIDQPTGANFKSNWRFYKEKK